MQVRIFHGIAEVPQHGRDINHSLLTTLFKKRDESDCEEDQSNDIHSELNAMSGMSVCNRTAKLECSTRTCSSHSSTVDCVIPSENEAPVPVIIPALLEDTVSVGNGNGNRTVRLYFMSKSTLAPPTSAIFSATVWNECLVPSGTRILKSRHLLQMIQCR